MKAVASILTHRGQVLPGSRNQPAGRTSAADEKRPYDTSAAHPYCRIGTAGGVLGPLLLQQIKLETRENEMASYDGAAIRFDVVDSECRYPSETILGRFQVMQVWASDGERCQMAAIQYTAFPAWIS